MNRLHIHIGVSNLDRSVDFYASLFGQDPDVKKPDYAKWLLDDPRVNFAISTQAAKRGLDHLGIQVESGAQLAEISGHLASAGHDTRDEPGAACCYARSDKAWAADPEDLSWELFHTTGAIDTYRGEQDSCCAETEATEATACCGT